MIAEYFVNLPLNFVKGIINFLYIWYVSSSRDFWHKEIGFAKGIENEMGAFINLKLLFQPIYGDYSYIGRVIGPIFRFGRVLVGFFMMLISIVVVVVIYLIWIILPPLTFLMIYSNLTYIF
ncbi:MAG: hypothetical protein KAI67_03285 [Candidatus Pacebacteria bacterium]|nr:hypothetical protein [Candidatus Paceibacterota bacterium]